MGPRRVGFPPPWWVTWSTQGLGFMWSGFFVWLGKSWLWLVVAGGATVLVGCVRWFFANQSVTIQRRGGARTE